MLGQAIEDPLGDLIAVVAGRKRDDEREFVPPEPHEQIGIADACGEPAGGLAQQLVAGVMTEGVVDLFEVVEVDQDQGDPVAPAGRLQALFTELEEVTPVPEAGELVGNGLAMGIGEPLHLPEADERPAGSEQQRERRQRDGHDGQAADR